MRTGTAADVARSTVGAPGPSSSDGTRCGSLTASTTAIGGDRRAIGEADRPHSGVVLDGVHRGPRADLPAAGADHVGQAVDQRRPPAVEVQHPVGGEAQLAGRGAGVEHVVVRGVRRRAQDRGEDGAALGRISDGAVDPLLGGASCPPLGLGASEPGERPQQPAPLADAGRRWRQARHDAVAGHERGAVQLRHATGGAHAERRRAPCPSARCPVQGVRTEVEIEAVTPAGPGPAAEVLGALQQDDRAAGLGERGGRREPGEAATDDDGVRCVHAIETIDRRPL